MTLTDAGPIIAILDADDVGHAACVAATSRSASRYSPQSSASVAALRLYPCHYFVYKKHDRRPLCFSQGSEVTLVQRN